jgi:hypothetical protein
MESHNGTNRIEYTRKKEQGVIIFDQDGITIPENLSKKIIDGKISTHIARKILFKDDGGYFFKFDELYYIKTFYSLRNRKYTIKIVGNRTYSIGSGSITWSREFYFPILRFKNLESAEYHEMLQILKEINAVSDTGIKEAENMDNEQNQHKIVNRYMYLLALTGIPLLIGVVLRSYLSGNERIILVIYNIILGGGFAFNMLMFFLMSFRKNPSNIEKLRRHLVLQYIEGIFVVLVISIVFTFALTR